MLILVAVFVISALCIGFTKPLTRKKASKPREGTIRYPAWSSDGRHIAFLYSLAGNTDVVTLNLDTKEVVNITASPGVERDMAWSPDGTVLLYSSQKKDGFDICAFNVQEEKETCLTEGGGDDFFPVWRPDGKEIAFCNYSEGKYKVHAMATDGRGKKEIYAADSCFSTWSPDGKKMAVTTFGDILVIDIERNALKNITRPMLSGDWVDDTLPIWSPKKDRILLLGRFESYLSELYVLTSGGKKLARLSDNVYEDFFPSWSPDGRYVAYAAYVQYKRNTTEIFISRDDGTDKKQLTDNWVFDLNPTFSPDGAKLFFVRREHHKDKAYMMTLKDTKATLVMPEGIKITRTIGEKGKKK